MNPLLIAFVGVLLVPLFVASWRLGLYALAGQGFLMAGLAFQIDPEPTTAVAWLRACDLVLVRGIAAPLSLYLVLRSRRASDRDDIVPPNLMSWTLAIALVIGAFRFADLIVPSSMPVHGFIAAAAAALLLGFLVFATQTGPFSQMLGALWIENAIAVFEIAGGPAHGDVALHAAQMAVFVVTVLLFRWYLATLPRPQLPLAGALEGIES